MLPGSLSVTNYAIADGGVGYNATAATAAGTRLTLLVTPGGPAPLSNTVGYSAAIPDLRGLNNDPVFPFSVPIAP